MSAARARPAVSSVHKTAKASTHSTMSAARQAPVTFGFPAVAALSAVAAEGSAAVFFKEGVIETVVLTQQIVREDRSLRANLGQ